VCLNWKITLTTYSCCDWQRRFRARQSVQGTGFTRVHFSRLAVLIIAVTCNFSASARTRIHTLNAHVRFLATGTVVRGTLGLSQDIYLAELTPSVNESPQVIRLIDEYFPGASPISREALTSASGTTLKVWRDSQCDLAYGAMVLRTAPGDPLAALPEPLGYQPKMDHIPRQNTILPCYRTVRR
jgi:hypothetical protein